MNKSVEKNYNNHHIIDDSVCQQDLQVHARLEPLLRAVIAEKYHDKMDAETIESNVQDLARRMTAHIANLGLNQYCRVRTAITREK